MFHFAVKRTSMRKNSMTDAGVEFGQGDVAENVCALHVRHDEDLNSEIVGTLPEKESFTIIEVGACNRVLISVGTITGWITTRTDLGQPLITKVREGNGLVLEQGEAVTDITVRAEAELKSEKVGVLPKGSVFGIIEECPGNLVKILVDDQVGWINSKTDLGQGLIVMLGRRAPAKFTKTLDTFVIRTASSAVASVPALALSASSAATGVSVSKVRSTKSSGSSSKGDFSEGKLRRFPSSSCDTPSTSTPLSEPSEDFEEPATMRLMEPQTWTKPTLPPHLLPSTLLQRFAVCCAEKGL